MTISSSTKENENAIKVYATPRRPTSRDRPKLVRKPRPVYAGFELEKKIDPTGKAAHLLFVQHYSRNNLPPPEVGQDALELYQRHADGSYNQKNYGIVNRRNAMKEARNIYSSPLVQNMVPNSPSGHIDVPKVQLQSNQSVSAAHRYLGSRSGSDKNHAHTNPQKSLADEAWDVYKQLDIQSPQPSHSESHSGSSVSGNNYPYNNPQLSPEDDLYKHFDVPSPPHLDFEEHGSINNPSPAVAIDKYHISLSNKYRNHS